MGLKSIENWPVKTKEAFYLSKTPRFVHDFAYRQLFRQEYNALKEYCKKLRGKKFIAIGLGHVYFTEHIRDLFPVLGIHPKIAPLFFCPSLWRTNPHKTELLGYLEENYQLLLGKNLFSLPWLTKQQADVFLEMTVTSYMAPATASRIIYSHGLSGLSFSKDFRHVRLLDRYNILCLTGPLQRKALTTAQKKYGGKLPRLVEVGYLRGDRLLEREKNYDRSALFSKLGLEDIPTILYAPTWGEFSSCKDWFDQIIQVCQQLGVNLLLRLHPIMCMEKGKWQTGGIDWNVKLREAQLHQNVRAVLGQDIDEYFLASDAMITDVSGMGLEYMVLKKPVIFLPADNFFQLYGEERPEMWVRKGMEVKTAGELKTAINTAIKRPSLSCSVDQIVYNRGQSLAAMVNLLEQVVDGKNLY